MKLKSLCNVLLSCLLFTNAFTNIANAGLIAETWQATISSSSPTNLYQVNDTVSWTITYDDTSLMMHEYSDGVDGRAQTNDDTLSYTWDASCPSGSYCNNYSLFADAVFDFSDLLQPIYDDINATPGREVRDNYTYNFARRYDYTHNGNYYANLRNDELYFHAYGNNNSAGNGSLYLYASDITYRVDFNDVQITSTQNYIENVPEPHTLVLFVLGLLAFSSRRLQKL